MNIYLIAEKLSHSYSPLIHSKFNKYSYDLKELPPNELVTFMTKKDFDGLNVTIPYKIDVIPYLDKLSDEAKKIGSVNTVTNVNGFLTGYNTDLYGFLYLIKSNNIDFKNKKVLILGNGGASKTVQAAVDILGVKEAVVIKRQDNRPEILYEYSDFEIIINTTPVGMYPKTGISPVDLNQFNSCTAVVDLIYNPAKTQILLDAEKRGIKAVNGLEMLVAQAKKACEIFTNQEISDSVISEISIEIENNTKNIVLIGMPGSGKTTIGKHLANKLSRTYFDTDEEIERTGTNIQDVITNCGELKFRELEHEVASKILNKSSCVISTGGGLVTYEPNIELLKQNSIVFFINRSVEKLATNGRPLSAGGLEKLKELYNKRIDIYKQTCDFQIENNSDIENAINQILNKLKRGNV